MGPVITEYSRFSAAGSSAAVQAAIHPAVTASFWSTGAKKHAATVEAKLEQEAEATLPSCML
jgi:hypothetical protein